MNVLAQIIIYIAELIHTSQTEEELNDYWFLGISRETLQAFGMRMPFKIKDNGQIYRLFSALYASQGLS